MAKALRDIFHTLVALSHPKDVGTCTMQNKNSELAPIIIKRKKVVKGDEHHGGAWKVAYADFVTAMMAFFLLMWLLNATTEQQRKGLADYFNPTIPISRISGGGSDGLNGSSIFTEETYANMGTGAAQKRTVAGQPDTQTEQLSPEELTKRLEEMQVQLSEDNGRLSEHMAIKISPEGIILELVDSEDTPLFSIGQSEATPLLHKLLDVVSGSFDQFENDVKIVGHTDNTQYRGTNGYDNWDLSLDRSNVARRLLIANGVPTGRIREVAGKADTDPLVPDNPGAAQNRRISIVMLTN